MTVPGERIREDVIRDLTIRYGIPANPVTFAATPAEAADAAANAPGDVAIKLIADGMIHKSKAGGVLLGVAPDQVETAVKQLFDDQAERGVTVRGVTIEPMIPAGPEIVVGALHASGFGPVVMVGTGGVDVETIGDVAFALAPVDRDTALQTIDRTTAGQVLGRRLRIGREQLADMLVAVAGTHGLLMSEPVDQIDLNPVVVGANGIVAVDARAVVRPEGCDEPITLPDPAVAHDQLRAAIYPNSIAVLGASASPEKMGTRAVRSALDQGFSGPIFPVSRSATEILGLPAVASVADLPEGIDRAVVALPAPAVLQALKDLAGRGVRSAHVYTADTDDLAEAVAGTDLRVLGPNCIGHYSPHTKLTMISRKASSDEPGSIAVVSQSGTYAGDVVRRGAQLGLRFSFVSSVGNCDDVSPSELLAFCAADPRTRVAAFYLEDDADAQRFFSLARQVDLPVVLFKGGRSAAGGAAAASHTGALAGDPRLLRDAAAAAGVVLVDSLDELLDTLVVAQHAQVKGPGLALVGSGGGVAVVGSDVAHEHDLTIPALGEAAATALTPYQAPGSSLDNPVDIPIWSLFDGDTAFTGALVEAMAADPGIDCLCAYLDLGTVFDMRSGADAAALIDLLTRDILAADRSGVPLVLVLRTDLGEEQEALARRLRTEAATHGVPVLGSVDRAIAALGRARALTSA